MITQETTDITGEQYEALKLRPDRQAILSLDNDAICVISTTYNNSSLRFFRLEKDGKVTDHWYVRNDWRYKGENTEVVRHQYSYPKVLAYRTVDDSTWRDDDTDDTLDPAVVAALTYKWGDNFRPGNHTYL